MSETLFPLLKGSYKNREKRKRRLSDVCVVACPGCDWFNVDHFNKAEDKLRKHLTEVHGLPEKPK